jgi:hypothetical protein
VEQSIEAAKRGDPISTREIRALIVTDHDYEIIEVRPCPRS